MYRVDSSKLTLTGKLTLTNKLTAYNVQGQVIVTRRHMGGGHDPLLGLSPLIELELC